VVREALADESNDSSTGNGFEYADFDDADVEHAEVG
jgi:hypothetical protein